MAYCDCACAREVDRLRDELRTLEHQITSLRYDLEREVDDRRSAVHMLANDITEVSMAATNS
jgi:hypothetical protein